MCGRRCLSLIHILHEVLPQQEDAEGVGGKGDDLGQQGGEEPGLGHEEIDGDKGHLVGDHEGQEHQPKQKVLPLELVPGEDIGGGHHEDVYKRQVNIQCEFAIMLLS